MMHTRDSLKTALIALILLIALAAPAIADEKSPDPLLSGSRSNAWWGGLTGSGSWAGWGFYPTVNMNWSISAPSAGSSLWTYTYTIDPTDKAVKSVVFETDTSVTSANFNDYFKFPAGYNVSSPQTWTGGSGGWWEPTTYGFRINSGGNPATYTFQSALAPAWGDVYASGGKDGATWVQNASFGSDPFNTKCEGHTNWVATPRSVVAVPEPSIASLLCFGLAGLVFFTFRRKKTSAQRQRAAHCHHACPPAIHRKEIRQASSF